METFDQLLGAAETDPVLAEWITPVLSGGQPCTIASARLIARTIRHNTRLWFAERRQMWRDGGRARAG